MMLGSFIDDLLKKVKFKSNIIPHAKDSIPPLRTTKRILLIIGHLLGKLEAYVGSA